MRDKMMYVILQENLVNPKILNENSYVYTLINYI